MKKEGKSMWSNALKGFLAGSLIIGSVINPLTLPIQIILFIIGILILLDALLLYGKNTHPGTTSVISLIGAVFSILFTALNYVYFYLAIILFVSVLLYIYRLSIREKISERRGKKEENI